MRWLLLAKSASEQVETMNKCIICECEVMEEEGCYQGLFGMLPVLFCPTCFSCLVEMVNSYYEDPINEQLLKEKT